jgi:ribonucleoside-diphosphate reductase alpha chain
MHGEAYKQSSIVARDHGGPFASYDENREPFLRVINKHRDAAYRIPPTRPSRRTSTRALGSARPTAHRNAQVTVLAPTGTIAFMMDCDTTGSSRTSRSSSTSSSARASSRSSTDRPGGLRKLGYGAEEVDEIIAYLTEHETIEGAPHLKPQHLPVFGCGQPANGERSIHYMGHVRMMGAIQPFISGAISKTVNMPEAATARRSRRSTSRLEARPQGDRRLRQLNAASRCPPARRRTATRRTSRPRPKGRSCAQLEARLRRHSPIDAGSRPSARRSPTVRYLGPRGIHHRGALPDGQPARSS